MLCKILIINMLDYKFKRFIFNILLTDYGCKYMMVFHKEKIYTTKRMATLLHGTRKSPNKLVYNIL